MRLRDQRTVRLFDDRAQKAHAALLGLADLGITRFGQQFE